MTISHTFINVSAMISYLITFILIVVTFGVQRLVEEHLGFVLPAAFYLPTFFVSLRYGFKQTLFAIVLAFAILYTFTPFSTDPNIITRSVLYAFTSIIISYQISRHKRAQHTQQAELLEYDAFRKRFDRSREAVNLGIWYCDLPFKDLIWSPEVKAHFWLPADAHVTIDTFYERIHPDDRAMTRDAVETSIKTNSPYDITYRTTNPENPKQVKYIRAIGWTDYNEKNEPIRFDGITLDNTELETINKLGSMVAAELDLEKIVQSVTDAATQLAKAQYGAFFYKVVNEKGDAYTLYTISGVPREKFSSFPMPRNTAIFAPTFKGERVVRSDDITKDPNYGKNAPYFGKPMGHLPVVSYLAVPVVSKTGEVMGALFFGHEKPAVFTEKEEKIVVGLASQASIAMENARLVEKLRQSLKARDEFISISSHELKTPLTPLTLHLQGIIRQIQNGTPISNEKILFMLERSVKQVSRLTRLVDDLLDVTRITSGKLTLNYENVNLQEVVEEVSERYHDQILASQNKLDLKTSSVIVHGDRLRLEQVFINLLTNAIKYAPGTPIHIELKEVDGSAQLTIADEGPGIPSADHHKVFERFERSVANQNQSGLGLGLYICKQIIEAHGGKIEVKSNGNTGSMFLIILPK